MDTISIKQGESLSIGFTFNSSYDESRIVDMLLYLDGVLIGRKSSGTLNKTTCYSAYVSSDETFIMEGYRDVILVLEDVELGVRKFIIAGVEFDKLADEFHADVDNNGYNILLELTVDETTLYGTSTLIEVLRGPSGSGVLPSGGTAGQTIIKNSNIDQDYSWGNPTQVNADWNATSGYAQILNKPNVLTVQQQVDWNATAGVTSILNKPIIITPVNSDWNSTTGLSAILNKPTYFPASDVYPWAKQSEKPQYNYSEILDHPTLISYFTNDAGYTTNMGTVTSITAGIGLTGGTITSSGTISLATQLPNGETATTQPRGDNSNKVATTAYCDNIVQPFSGVTVKPSYINNGDGSVTIGTGEYTLNSQTDGSGYFKNYTITGGTFTLIDGVTNYIYADYNSGAPEIKNIITLSGINDLTTTPIYTLNRIGTYISVLDWDSQGLGLANKLTMRLRQTERFSVVPGGLTIGELPTRRITIGSGTVWYGATYVSIPASDSGDGTTNSKLFVYNGSTWSYSLQTQYNNTQYQGASGLVPLSGNHYGVIWVYKGVESERDQYIVLGTGSYSNISLAQASIVPSNLPPIIPIHTILVGRIIVKNGESVATQIDNYLITGVSSAGISDHIKLSNLTWNSSGHIGTINTIASFDSNGLATNIPTSNYYLSSNPAGYTSNLGTVTNVSTYIDTAGNDIYVETSNSTTTPQINIHIPTASATKRGALSSTDWNTFNNKLSSISYNQPSNGTYQLLWGSGNSIYGNSNITCNPYTGILSATQFSGSGAGLTGFTSSQITTALGYTPLPTRTFGTAANNNTGDFYAAGSTVANSTKWNNLSYSLGNVTTPYGLLSTDGYNVGYSLVADIKSWLGLGSNAYTSTAYLPLSGGTMFNTNLVGNLNAQYLNGTNSNGYAKSDFVYSSDLNLLTYTRLGGYSIVSSNKPSSTDGYLININFDNGNNPRKYIAQQAIDSYGNSYTRLSLDVNATTWSSWRTIYDSSNLTQNLSTNYIPKWNGSSFVNSLISDDGTNFGVGTPVIKTGVDRIFTINRASNDNTRTRIDVGSYPGYTGSYIDATHYYDSESGTGLILGYTNTGGISTDGLILDKFGNITIPGTIQSTGVIKAGASGDINYNVYMRGNYSTYNAFEIGIDNHKLITTADDYNNGGTLQLWTADAPKITIVANGNVGIGYTSDQGYKLAVNGNVFASGFKTSRNSASYLLATDGSDVDASTIGVINNTQSTVLGSVSGSAVFGEPIRASAYKKILIKLVALYGSATYTIPVSFTYDPEIIFTTAGVSVTKSTTSITISTPYAISGWVVLEGY